MTLFFESFILLAWFLIFNWERRKKNQLEQFILLYSLPMTFIMEVINDVYFGSLGMIYPHSFFYLRPFNFPIPIILSGSLYCWSLHKLSLKTSSLYLKTEKPNLVYFIMILILLNSWYFIEQIGQSSGYWMRIGGIQYTNIVITLTYFFYFSFTMPSIIFSILTLKFLSKGKEEKDCSTHCIWRVFGLNWP